MGKRYIDADALKKVLTKLADDPWNANANTTWSKAYDYCIEYLDEQPTADVRENVKGKWIDETFKPWGLVNHPYKCDQCGEHSEYGSNYCPNCGAEMKGEDDENNNQV